MINSMGFLGYPPSYSHFFLGKMMKNDDRKPRWILGFSIFNKGHPQRMSQQRQELLPLPRRLVEQLPGLIFIEGIV